MLTQRSCGGGGGCTGAHDTEVYAWQIGNPVAGQRRIFNPFSAEPQTTLTGTDRGVPGEHERRPGPPGAGTQSGVWSSHSAEAIRAPNTVAALLAAGGEGRCGAEATLTRGRGRWVSSWIRGG